MNIVKRIILCFVLEKKTNNVNRCVAGGVPVFVSCDGRDGVSVVYATKSTAK